MQELYCGIDIGTSSAKAVVYDETLQPVFGVDRHYDFAITEEDRAELDPETVYRAVAECLGACTEQKILMGAPLRFFAFSAALHSFIAVNVAGRPLTNCITWADMRATEFNTELSRCCEGRIYHKTGCPGNAIYMPGKILWIRKYLPHVYAAASRYITIKEYILWKLTGEWIVDYGIASGGGVLNIENPQWDQDLLQMLGLTPSHFSNLVDGPTRIRMKRRIATDIGADIPLVVGSGDGPLANLGAGTYGTERFVATIGSSGAVRIFAKRSILDPQQRTWCYRLDGQTYLAGGAINNGGIVLKWLRENCFHEEAAAVKQNKNSIYQVLNDYGQAVPAGSNGLLFLPFLTGERSPDWNSKARGLIIGLNMAHSKKEIVRAAMEGVVMRLYTNFLVLRELVGDTDEIIVNGGFTRSRIWLQIMADVFNKKLLLFENTADSTLGAVLMGLKAVGRIDAYDQVPLKLRLKETIRPDRPNAARYREIHRLYEAVYEANKPFFETLHQLRKTAIGKSTDHTEVVL